MEIPKILIGSRAINHWYSDFSEKVRQPKDIDYAVLEKDIRTSKDEDKTVVEYLYNPILFDKQGLTGMRENKSQLEYLLKPNGLLTLKLSHLFWDINFDKHLGDALFLFEKGCKYDLQLLEELRKHWDTYLPTVRRSQLKMTKEDFFTNAVNEDVDQHDNSHIELSLMIGKDPAYKQILVGEVEVSEELFNNLSFEEKVRVAQEESIIMCRENRFSKNTPSRVAFAQQLKSCIMKHYPQCIALFAIENYKTCVKPKEHQLTFLKQYFNK